MSASVQNFRTALYGFNRDDVVQFIENTGKKYEAQVAQLRDDLNRTQEENRRLQTALESAQARQMTQATLELQETREKLEALTRELEAAKQDAGSLADERDAARKEAARLAGQLDAAKKEAARLADERDTAQKEAARLAAELDAAREELARQKASAAPDYQARELEAYRRAEEVERQAGIRAARAFDQAAGTIAEATVRLETAGVDLNTVSGRLLSELEALRQSVSAGKDVLSDTAAQLRSQKP